MDEEIAGNWRFALLFLKARPLNLQSKLRAFKTGEHHYDIGNELYSLMLGKAMAYSCGYWKNAADLDEAQEANHFLRGLWLAIECAALSAFRR